jgi:hypothetical protein
MDHRSSLSSANDSGSRSRRSSAIMQSLPNVLSNKRLRAEPDSTHEMKPKHNSRELRTCSLFRDCSRCGSQGFRVYNWFLKHFRDEHLTSYETVRAQTGSSEYVCSGKLFATSEALARHIWKTYTVPIQRATLTQASHLLFTAPSTPLPSGISTPVPPASQAYANPLFGGPTGAGYAPASAPGSSSVQANPYQPSFTSNNVPANNLSFDQSFCFPAGEEGMPLPPQNGNIAGYPGYASPWVAGTQ